MNVNIDLIIRRACLVLWVAIPLAAVLLYFSDPESFGPPRIAEFLHRFESEVFIVYLGLSILRGFTLLPSTPLVIAGTILYPQQPWLVLFVSLTGILLSSGIIYYFSDFLGFTDFFERKQPEYVQKIRLRLEKPTGWFFVFLWAFFPFVPTDAVCYVAGTLQMTLWKFIIAVLLGELVICTFYIFFGSYVWIRWN